MEAGGWAVQLFFFLFCFIYCLFFNISGYSKDNSCKGRIYSLVKLRNLFDSEQKWLESNLPSQHTSSLPIFIMKYQTLFEKIIEVKSLEILMTCWCSKNIFIWQLNTNQRTCPQGFHWDRSCGNNNRFVPKAKRLSLPFSNMFSVLSQHLANELLNSDDTCSQHAKAASLPNWRVRLSSGICAKAKQTVLPL